jgi:hypothetical protein
MDSAGVFHGFLLTQGVFTQIDVPGALDTEAIGINSRDEIVGGCVPDWPSGFTFPASEPQGTSSGVGRYAG